MQRLSRPQPVRAVKTEHGLCEAPASEAWLRSGRGDTWFGEISEA